MKTADLSMITSYTSDAARYFAMSLADAYQSKERSLWIDEAIADFKKAANKLGYDLVKRQTPAEMHDAAIAARVAEDRPAVTEAPGFDGRAPAIADNEWSR